MATAAETILCNVHAKARRVIRNGREWFVAPATTIVPGVLAGSKGALYYPEDEIKRSVKAWDRMPLLVNHPTSPTGENVSARHAGVYARQGIGFIQGSAWKGKLVHEAWFDAELTRKVDNRIFDKLSKGEPIELSTGLFTDNHDAPAGSHHNGRSYQYIARNYRPDHLAILPDQVGACSIADGCGVLVNAKSDELSGGRWVTTEAGNHLYIKDGQPVAGNPKVLAAAKSKASKPKADQPLQSPKGQAEKQSSGKVEVEHNKSVTEDEVAKGEFEGYSKAIALMAQLNIENGSNGTVIRDGGKVIAIASHKVDKNTGEIEIKNLASSRKGAGTQLLREVAKVAAKQGRGIYLEGQATARGFYEKMGMKAIGDPSKSRTGNVGYEWSKAEVSKFAVATHNSAKPSCPT